MKSMEQMQEEMLSKCYKKNGWPKPFVSISGVVQLARDQEHLDRLIMAEFWAVVTAFVIVGTVSFFSMCGASKFFS